MKKYYLLLLGLLFNYLCSAQNNIICIKNAQNTQMIGKEIFFLEEQNHLDIQTILSQKYQQQFQQYDKEVFAEPSFLGITWFKITVKNQSSEQLWLEVGGSFTVHYLDFYAVDSTGKLIKTIQTGVFRPSSQKAYPVNMYWLPLQKDSSTQTFYLSLKGIYPRFFPLSVGSLAALHKNKEKQDYLIGAFVGWVLVMIFYNLFLGFTTPYRIYFLYSWVILHISLITLFVSNYFISENVWFWEYFWTWSSPTYFFEFLFFSLYLKIAKNMPKINVLMWIWVLVIAFLYPILDHIKFPFTDVFTNLYQFLCAFFYLVLLCVSIYLWTKGLKNARFYTLSWSAIVLGIVIMYLTVNGIIPFNLLTNNISLFSSQIESLMFSLALADRLGQLKKEKENAQNQNIQLIKEQNLLLEIKVEQRTHEIYQQKQKIEQLADFKNLMIEMLVHDFKSPMQKLSFYAEKNYFTDNYLFTSIQGILKMVDQFLKIQQIERNEFYLETEKVAIKKFMKAILEQEKVLFQKKNISLQSELEDSWVSIDKNLFKRVIENILFNAYKYTSANGKVFVWTKNKENYLEIGIKDNGKGISQEKLNLIFDTYYQAEQENQLGISSGLGLTFCKMVIEKHQGSIHAFSEPQKGTSIVFYLPFEAKTSVENTKIILSESEKEAVKNMIWELEKTDFFEWSSVKKIIESIPSEGNLGKWKDALKNTFFEENEADFRKLIKMASIH
ncbi:MAG: hypothetical protein EAZ97_15245 [Bacteroidetes bacterium]|nr:MAG: hypothetical protein EAZ97_15245 [Bacteroidota bacterium]